MTLRPALRILTALLPLALAPAAAAAQQAQPLTLRPPPQSARVYARDGSLIAELGPQVRTVVSMRSLPAYLPRAFVAVEDRRFYEHGGVDAVGIARAVQRTIAGDRQGASTITQQLIGAMFPEQVDRRELTPERKLREMRMAVELEGRYSKDRILEAYLNQVYFGHGWYGVEAAARHYFGKGAAQVSHEEAAMLVAVVNGPGVYSPKINPARALQRRNLVLGMMADAGIITRAQATAAQRRPIRLAPNHGYSARPAWVIDQVRQYLEANHGADWGTKGLRVWTSVDPAIQTAADSALQQGLRRVEAERWYRGPRHGTPAARATAQGTNYLQGVVVTVDARTGEILAMVGGRDVEDSRFNRATAGRRQAGSSFKPMVYAAAIEAGVMPGTWMQDTALAVQLPGSPVYRPQNSDEVFRGPVTLRDALVASINTVAVQLGLHVGLDRLPAVASRFGITATVRPYPSSVLGTAAVKPLEMAGAYTAFANRGLRVEPFLVRRVVDLRGNVLFDRQARGHRAVSPEVAFLVTDMLEDAAERGTGREARRRLPAAVPMAGKTGTTDDGTDVWYVGYTPEMVTAVWVGFDTPRPIGPAAYGGTIAAPVWGEMMGRVYARRRVPARWALPAGVREVAVDSATRMPAGDPCPAAPAATELYLATAVPAGACVKHPDGTWGPAGGPAPLPGDPPVGPDSLPALPPPDTTGTGAAEPEERP